MNEKKNDKQQPKDRSLDTPSVANEEKHINFLAEEEEPFTGGIDLQNEEDEQRKQEWQKGIEEGKRENNNQ